jgi:hypothetical protein
MRLMHRTGTADLPLHDGRAPSQLFQRMSYDRTIAYLESAVRRAKLGERDRLTALRRLRATA